MDPSEIRLVSLTCAWADDGSLFRISLRAIDERGDSVNVMNSRKNDDGDETTLYASSIREGSSGVGLYEEMLRGDYPTVTDALSLIDAVGPLQLGQTTVSPSGHADGYVLHFARPELLDSVDVVEEYTHGSPALKVHGGVAAPLDQGTRLSSLGPVDVFVLWRAELAGGETRGSGPPIAYCFMQRPVG